MSRIEPCDPDRPSLRRIVQDIGSVQLATGFVAFLFAATGPLAIILSVGQQGGLSPAQISSFVFGVFAINGLITLLMTWAYRMPLALFWTIPGTVLMGPALTHLSFPEIIGAFYATSVLVLVLGWTGLARRALACIPMPIVMAMVAGLFLKFGIDIIRSLHQDFAVAGAMVVAFFGLMASPTLAHRMPPLIGALIVGVVAALAKGGFASVVTGGIQIVQPVVTPPVFSVSAMTELVIPFAITILLVQNGQGLAVMSQSGHKAPVTAVTLACGIGGLANALVGAVGTALTGPTAGLITSAGPREKHYATAMVTAALAILFGLMAPTFTQLMLSAPKALILTLGGLAMLRVLLGSFTTAFKGPFAFGAMTCFVVTVADLPLCMILVIDEVRQILFGKDVHSVAAPEWLQGSFKLTEVLSYPIYRVALCVACLILAGAIFYVIQKTRLGMIIRAGAENRDMTRALGIPFDVVNRYVFAGGIALAALGGILVAPVSTVFPGMGDGMLILSFVVVVLGGIGSVAGAAIGALLIGLTDTFGKVFFPQVSSILIYVLMAGVLLWRPNGLLGKS